MGESDNKNALLRHAEEKKLLRPKDLADIKGVRVLISRLVESGELVKVGRGLYSIPTADYNEQQSLLEIAQRVPKAVVCLLSALRFHELTTQNPFEVWIAIEGMSRKPSLQDTPLRVMRFSGTAFTEGVEIRQINGISLKVYNPAKTVVDCFKYRNKVGIDVAIEALRDAWSQQKTTMDELWHYAKICRVSNVMRPYLESLI